MSQSEPHRLDRVGWLRASVLGANDGLLSTASLVMGVAAANPGPDAVLLAGIAALTAGALSMAAGEYVSVSSQADLETAEIGRESEELATMPAQELTELAAIYRKRGLSAGLAQQVAEQLTANDALGAHLRDELGITEISTARPLQAALASAASFAVGGLPPILLALLAPPNIVLIAVGGASVLGLAVLGWLAAWVGGAPVGRSMARVMVWGVIAMGVTAGVGHLVGQAL